MSVTLGIVGHKVERVWHEMKKEACMKKHPEYKVTREFLSLEILEG